MIPTDPTAIGFGGPAARFVGQSVARKEDSRLLTGHGQYVDREQQLVDAHLADPKRGRAEADTRRIYAGVFALGVRPTVERAK